jgi:hypothetical protein
VSSKPAAAQSLLTVVSRDAELHLTTQTAGEGVSMLRILAALMVLCSLSSTAIADEVWVCHFPEAGNRAALERYWLRNGRLVELDEPYVFYAFVSSTDLAIIAMNGTAVDVDLFAPTPANPSPVIGSDTLAINRKTGEAIKGYVSLYDSNTKHPSWRGRCWQQKTEDDNAVWPPGYKTDE